MSRGAGWRYRRCVLTGGPLRRGELLVALAVGAYGQLEVWLLHPEHLVGPLGGLAVSVACSALLLAWRCRYPLLVQALVVAVTVTPWARWGASQAAGPLLALTVATYSVGRYGRRPAAFVGAPIAVGAIELQLVLDPLQNDLAGSWGWTLYGAAFWGAGAWMRQRAELERRRDAERTQRQRAALAEERTRIARELHDILAHSLGAMVLQAEAAEELLDREPQRVRRPLNRIQGAGREALQEIRDLLVVLRTDASSTAVEDSDVSDLPDLEPLVAQFRETGLPVTLERIGIGPVPRPVARAVYRLAQEALTNVIRHGGAAPTRVVVSITPDEAAVDVENDGALAPPTAAAAVEGHGLIGIQERVAACGGSVIAGPREVGGFAVRARFPLAATP